MSNKRNRKRTTFEYIYFMGRTYEVRPYLSAAGVAVAMLAVMALPAAIAVALYVTFG